MTLATPVPNKSLYFNSLAPVALIIASAILGLYLMFQDPLLSSFFDSDSVDWYVNYSKTIFQPTYEARVLYWEESILLPLIGNLLNASQSLAAYKILCAYLIVSILPALTALTLYQTQSIRQSVLFLALFSYTYIYLREMGLGYPDPLTLLLMFAATFQRSLFLMAFFIALAALSHFSMATVSTAALITLFITTPQKSISEKIKKVLFALLGLGIGRLLLQAWYWKYDYLHVTGRINWFFDRGPQFFLDRYNNNVLGFWLTPSLAFLVVYALMIIYFIFQKKYLYSIASLIPVALAYGVLFCTLDGLREFAVVIGPAYAYFLLTFISSVDHKYLTKSPKRNA
jgi:hypothetical protein